MTRPISRRGQPKSSRMAPPSSWRASSRGKTGWDAREGFLFSSRLARSYCWSSPPSPKSAMAARHHRAELRSTMPERSSANSGVGSTWPVTRPTSKDHNGSLET
jgi:hypothetical protein